MIVITSDILKISQKSILDEGDQTINIDWLESLLSPVIHTASNSSIKKIAALENNKGVDRLRAYSKIGLPISTEGWIHIYEGESEQKIIFEVLDEYFNNEKFVICFEAPGYMIKYFNERKIKFIDLNISPIRFSEDYFFGARSNVSEIDTIIEKNKIHFDELLPDMTLIKTLAKRKIRKPLRGALFLGQIEVDASLIQDKWIPKIDDIKTVLEKLTLEYGNIYYKPHPHSGIVNELKNIVSKIKGCTYLERNIYDTICADEWDAIYSFSSGAIEEAKLVGRKATRLLQKHWHYEDINFSGGKRSDFCYKNIRNSAVFSTVFWRQVLNEVGIEIKNMPVVNIYKPGLFKSSLNQTWGR